MAEKKVVYVVYRQVLRNMQEQAGFPDAIDYPVDPLAPVVVAPVAA